MKGIRHIGAGVALAALCMGQAMAIDIDALWDFRSPAVSEQRFREAMFTATPDEQLILQTQIARTHGLRKDFARAGAVLAEMATRQATGSAEARTRWQLEMGRIYASATHPKTALTPEALATARDHYLRAFEIAQQARLDALAIDALHMMTVVDSEPAKQLAWNERAIALMEQSTQPDAKKWEGSLRNNTGYAYHLAGRYDDALKQFRLSRAAHERAGRTRAVRIADWMIAWTFRAQGRLQEALTMQLQLEKAWDDAGQPDPYVYEELEHLYRALGDSERAAHYGRRLAETRR